MTGRLPRVPELLEVEAYRGLAEEAVGRRVTGVEAPDPWYLKGGLRAQDLSAALVGRCVAGVRRRGKLLLLDSSGGPTLGLRFGMTGRLFLDQRSAVGELLYSSGRREPAWERFALQLDAHSRLVVSDPRRLGGVILEPEEAALGPDAVGLTLGQLRGALGGSRAPLKARLLDQSRLAGVGNLLADEMLWRAGLSPLRPAGSLDQSEMRRLHRHLKATIIELGGRGGSHTGDLMPARKPGAVCPRDGAELVRATVGGRTSWWCPRHQR
jgi:formamidopyrimidine-DNA glycosylase